MDTPLHVVNVPVSGGPVERCSVPEKCTFFEAMPNGAREADLLVHAEALEQTGSWSMAVEVTMIGPQEFGHTSAHGGFGAGCDCMTTKPGNANGRQSNP